MRIERLSRSGPTELAEVFALPRLAETPVLPLADPN